MHIVTDIEKVKAMTRRRTKKGVIEELVRQGYEFKICHDGWPILFIPEVAELPSRRGLPNLGALDA